METTALEDGKLYPVTVRTNFKFTNLRSWISLLIRLRYGSKCNHAAIFYRYRGQVWVYEADNRGVFPVLLRNWKRKGDEIYAVNLEEKKNSYARMTEKVGNKYDYFAFIRHLGRWVGWKKSKNSGKRMTCYEYVGFVYGLENWYKLRPSDLEKI